MQFAFEVFNVGRRFPSCDLRALAKDFSQLLNSGYNFWPGVNIASIIKLIMTYRSVH